MGWETDVLDGAIADLISAGIVEGTTGVAVTSEAQTSPTDRAIALSVRLIEDTPTGQQTYSIQARCRGNPRDRTGPTVLSDRLYDHWHGRAKFNFGPAHVALMWRQGHGMMGADTAGRWETSSNFYFHTERPTPGATYL